MLTRLRRWYLVRRDGLDCTEALGLHVFPGAFKVNGGSSRCYCGRSWTARWKHHA